MKKHSAKILSLILTFVLLIGCASSAFASSTDIPTISGTGTTSDPYQLTNREQVEYYMRAYPDKNFVVMNDIGFGQRPGQEFIPIDSFSGTLNGNGYAFTYLNIRDTVANAYTGFFRTLTVGSSVSNLRLRYLDSAGEQNVGGLAGIIAGSVDQIYVEGGCSISSTGYTYAVGGLCAMAEETANITNCILQSGTSVGGDIVGGLAGVNKSANYNNVFFLGRVFAIQGPYSIAGALYGRHFVMNSYLPAVNVYWNANRGSTYSDMQSAAGMVEVTPGVIYTGLEGLVGIKTPINDVTLPVGEAMTLDLITIPANAPVNGTWTTLSDKVTITGNVVTAVSQGYASIDFVMPFYGSANAVFPSGLITVS